MEACRKLRLGLGKVERCTVGLGVTCYKVYSYGKIRISAYRRAENE